MFKFLVFKDLKNIKIKNKQFIIYLLAYIYIYLYIILYLINLKTKIINFILIEFILLLYYSFDIQITNFF